MNQWTIGRRITIITGVLLGLLLLSSAISLALVNRLKQAANTMKVDALPGVVAIANIEENFFRSHIRVIMAGNAVGSEQMTKLLKTSEDQIGELSKNMVEYEKSIFLQEDRDNFTKLQALLNKYLELRKTYIDFLSKDNKDKAQEFLIKDLDAANIAFRDQMVVMKEWNVAYGIDKANLSYRLASQSSTITIVLSLVAIIAGLGISVFIIRGLNRTLRDMADLLGEASNQIASASSQVATASQTLAKGSSEQAASLEETSASVEELTSMAKRNSENAGVVQGLSQEVRTMTKEGSQQMQQLVSAMSAIKSSSDNIAKVVKTIDEIAFQTNILALNAAVEAARAGEAGAGFAVVADEVRSLAQRAALASKETAGMIEESIRTSGQGASLTEAVSTSLTHIDEKASKVGDLVVEITTSSKEQSQGLVQISTGVSQIDKVTQSNASSAEETASAAEELSSQSGVLKENVDKLLVLVGRGQM